MAITAEQETVILSRMSGGELPRPIMRSLGIDRADIRIFISSHQEEVQSARAAHRAAMEAAAPVLSKAQRLAALNARKSRVQVRLDRINQRIAVVEAESD